MKIAYWVFTGLFCFANLLSGVADLSGAEVSMDGLSVLGYPAYLATILGVWKLGGVLALLVPGFPSVKIWAYAGFFFLYSGAFVSYVAANQSTSEAAGPMILLIVMIGSYLLRENRRD